MIRPGVNLVVCGCGRAVQASGPVDFYNNSELPGQSLKHLTQELAQAHVEC